MIDPRPLFPILLAWGFAMAVIGVEDDIAFAMLIFTLFIALLWTATGRVGYLVFGLVLFAAGAILTAHLFVQVHERVAIWLDPWSSPYSNARQLAQAWFSMGDGGWAVRASGWARPGCTCPSSRAT